MYALALDESGTHTPSPVCVIAGLAVHEADIRRLETELHALVAKSVDPLRIDPWELEVHANEIKTPRPASTTKGGKRRAASKWLPVDGPTRLTLLNDLYTTVADFTPTDPVYPPYVFGAVVDRTNKSLAAAEKQAYDHVLHRYDEMLTKLSASTGVPERGLLIHDRRDGYERSIQNMTAQWQRTGARLDSLIQVPLFTDSRASRLVQAADLIAYAFWRHYGPNPDPAHINLLWDLVPTGKQGDLSGVIHMHPGFRSRSCHCRPCTSRHR